VRGGETEQVREIAEGVTCVGASKYNGRRACTSCNSGMMRL